MDSLDEVRRERAGKWASVKKQTDVIMLEPADNRPRSRSPRRRIEAANAPCEFRLMTWNIDGLDHKGTEEDMLGRTLWVVKEIRDRGPDVVFLQELVDFNFQIVSRFLGSAFDIHVQENPQHPYFVAVLVNKTTAQVVEKPLTIDFPSSKMGRAAIYATIRLKKTGKQVGCITAHLESLRESSAERRIQLSIIDSFVQNRNDELVIFGGDLNLRDNEVPSQWKDRDCWIMAGKDKEEEFTWDLVRNSNAEMPNGSKPRCRFDRVFVLKKTEMTVSSFKLVGTSPVEGLEGRFASDHFGLCLCLRF